MSEQVNTAPVVQLKTNRGWLKTILLSIITFGIYGLVMYSGISNDMRELEEGAIAGNEKCRLALDMYNRSVQKAIGSFYAIMPRTDAVVVTAGIGENSEFTRREIFEGLEHMGMIVDPEKNKGRGGDRVISADDSPVKVLIISADEEMCIARETMALI